ncbi:MAG: type II secretion system protein GspJ [Bdellovibrionota bacterium]
MKLNRGFTLIEVLISLAIMSTLGLLAAQAIRQSITQKKKIQTQLDEISPVRDGLRLMERDINLAYHHQDWEKELEDLIEKKPAGTTPTTFTPPVPGAPPPTTVFPPRDVERIDPTTTFVGAEGEIHFVTFNNARLMRNQKQADFVEVGYFLRECKPRVASAERSLSKCLWRRTSAIADEDVTKGGDEVVLLENVTEFKMRYLGAPKQDWVDKWRTDKESPEEVMKNRFPSAVEISLTVQNTGSNPPGKKYSMQIVASLHFPNNTPLPSGGANSATTGNTLGN